MKTVYFESYYKYVFTFKDKEGSVYEVGGDTGDIYRFSVSKENALEEVDGKFFIDGYEAIKYPNSL